MAGKGVRELIAKAKRGRDGISGPWKVYVSPKGGTMGFDDLHGELWHYGTQMLAWNWKPRNGLTDLIVTRTWTGWGSVSDQTGVNAALDALGSNLHYYRDTKGGGARINPFRVGSMVGGILRSASPAVYNPGMVFPPQLSYHNPRRRKRRR